MGSPTALQLGHAGREADIVALFTATFTASEGAQEGALIGGLVRRLLAGTPPQDLFVFTAREGGEVVGAVVFSRLRYDEDVRTVFILSPLAVAPDRQRRGIGQKLLNHALAALRAAGVDIAITYGDPDYYAQVGFAPVSSADAASPRALSQPEGWLARPLDGRPMRPLAGPSRCVAALDDPAFW